MATAKLRRSGGSTVVALPPAMLDALGLTSNARVDLTLEGQKLVLTPVRAGYTLDQLLAQCEGDADATQEDDRWLGSPPVGKELI